MKTFFLIIKRPVVIVSLLFIISTSGLLYYFVQYNRVAKPPVNDSKAETQKIVNEIKNLMIIPDDSNAVLATIADKSKLAGQKFFELAQNGDDVVLFPALGKAVLYRPTIHKIIDVGPFNPGGAAQPNTLQNTTATPSATLVNPANSVKKPITATTTKKTR